MDSNQVKEQLNNLSDGWDLSHEGRRIRKSFSVDNFLAGLDFFQKVAEHAEAMQHHPDLHIENYKDVWIEIWTHTANGLTQADFDLAARIDQL